jgi:hypothetical protein
MFLLVLHHGGVFDEFHHASYNGIETVLECEPDYWSYFSILSTVKRMGYPMVSSLWYHDPTLEVDLIRLRNDNDCRRMMNIGQMFERVHLYVEHTVGDQPQMGELNPLIEYPIQYPVHNEGENVGVHLEEIVEEVDNDGVAVEMDNEGENVGLGVEMENEGEAVDNENEGVAVEMENEGDDGNMETVVTDEGPTYVVDDRETVGPTVVEESVNVGPTVVEESVNVGPTILEEGINNVPTDLNMGVNESGPSGVVDEYVDENGSKGDGNESEDSALGVQFGDPEEEELCGEDGFGDGDVVGTETQQEDDLFADWINGPFENIRNEEVVNEAVPEGGTEAVAETERVTNKEAEAGQSKEKGKEASGSKPKKKRGRPPKQLQQQRVSEPVFEEDLIAEGVNNTEQGGPSGVVRDRGLSEDEDYDSEDLDSGCDTEDEDGGPGVKFPTFKMLDNMRDYHWELGTYFVSKKSFQDAIRTYAVHSGRDLKFRKNDKRRVRVICKGAKGNCLFEACCTKIPNEETWQLRKIQRV